MSAFMKLAHAWDVPQYHGYCPDHPEWEVDRCGPFAEIADAVEQHNQEHHTEEGN